MRCIRAVKLVMEVWKRGFLCETAKIGEMRPILVPLEWKIYRGYAHTFYMGQVIIYHCRTPPLIIKHSGSHPSDRVQLLPRTKISLFAINPYVAGKWTCHRSSWISFVSRTLGYWHCTGPVHIIILHSPRWLTQNLHIFMAQLRRKRIYARGNGCRAPHVAVLRWEAVHHRFCWDLACFEWVFFISTTHDLGD